MLGQAGARGLDAHGFRIVDREEQFTGGSQMQRRPAADGAHHLHARTLREGAVDVDDLIALAHLQIDRLMRLAMQSAHESDSRFMHAEPTFYDIFQFQQTYAEPIGAGLGTLYQPLQHQIVEDAMRRRRMQFGYCRQLLETCRVRIAGKRMHQGHQTFDDLNGGCVVFGGALRSLHGILRTQKLFISKCETLK